jgi:type III pantothenate kinase
MLLAIDVGNTNTVLGVFEDKAMIKSWRVKTDPRDTSDELWVRYSALVAGFDISALSICSTVPSTLRELRTMITNFYPDLKTTIVETRCKDWCSPASR